MKTQINEIKRMQQLAGILTEAEETQAISSGEKIADKVENNPMLQKAIDNLSDDQISQLKKQLADLGITPDSNIKDVAANIENEVPINEAEEDPKKKIANILSIVGGSLVKSLLIPVIPVAVGSVLGIGFAGGLAITFAAAGALIGLAKLLGEKENSTEYGNY
jgi:small-conductance mechanosensitive channel